MTVANNSPADNVIHSEPELFKPSKKPFWKTYGYLLLCMLIPAVIMYLIYLAREIHPFGN